MLLSEEMLKENDWNLRFLSWAKKFTQQGILAAIPFKQVDKWIKESDYDSLMAYLDTISKVSGSVAKSTLRVSIDLRTFVSLDLNGMLQFQQELLNQVVLVDEALALRAELISFCI